MSTIQKAKKLEQCSECCEKVTKLFLVYDDELCSKQILVCEKCKEYEACHECGWMCGEYVCKFCLK